MLLALADANPDTMDIMLVVAILLFAAAAAWSFSRDAVINGVTNLGLAFLAIAFLFIA